MARLLPLGVLALGLACGGGGGGPCDCGPKGGSVAVVLAGGPLEQGRSLTVQVASLDLVGDGGPVPLAPVAGSLETTELVAGRTVPLASGTPPSGTYRALRVTFAGGTLSPAGAGPSLTLPPTGPLRVDLAAPLELGAGSRATLALVLDPGLSLQPQGEGWLLRPEAQALQVEGSGRFEGRVVDEAGHPVAGLGVGAESLLGSGELRLHRRAVTDADGHYVLDLLPAQIPVVAVTWCAAPGGSYAPQATPTLVFGSTLASLTANFSLSSRPGSAALSGACLPPGSPEESDLVALVYGPILSGTNPSVFIVGIQVPQRASGEVYRFPGLPSGSTYQSRGRRRVRDAAGVATDRWAFSPDLGLLPGLESGADLLW